MGAPTSANTVISAADDTVANGIDDLVNSGHTLATDGSWHPAANSMGAPTASNTVISAADDTVANGIDDLINSGHTLATDGSWHPAANTAGAPTADSSAIANKSMLDYQDEIARLQSENDSLRAANKQWAIDRQANIDGKAQASLNGAKPQNLRGHDNAVQQLTDEIDINEAIIAENNLKIEQLQKLMAGIDETTK